MRRATSVSIHQSVLASPGGCRNARWREMQRSELVTVPCFSPQPAAGRTTSANSVVSVGQQSLTATNGQTASAVRTRAARGMLAAGLVPSTQSASMPPSRTLSNSSTAFSPFRQAIRGAPQNRRTRSTCAASANPIWAASWLASPPTSRPPIALGCPVNDSGPIPGRHAGEPLLDIHPADAERLGLAGGGLARIESRHGAAVLPVRLSADQRAGEVFAPMHWTDRFTSAGPIGRLVGAATDPISGQPELKATPVRMEAVTVLWRGIL